MLYAASSSATLRMRCAAPAFAAMYAMPTTASLFRAASEVVTMMRPTLARSHVARRCAQRGEHGVEVDFDDAIPALVRVALDGAFRIARPLRTHPPGHEARTGIDTGIGEHDVEPPVRRGSFVDGPIQRGVVAHIDHCAPHVVAEFPQPRGFRGDTLGIDIEQRHARAIRRQRFAEAEPEPAGAARDDDAVAFDFEQVCDLHGATLEAIRPRSTAPSGRRRPPCAHRVRTARLHASEGP